jgi:glycosyltransferase involved in cell wall biosynthesis
MNILVVIPAYNEAGNIEGVIKDLREHFPQGRAVVINDGSIDETSSISQGLGVDVINLPYNLGIGGAVQTGFMIAERDNYDAVIQFDGDGQHMAQEIEKILNHVNTEADMVIGSRFVDMNSYSMPFFRNIGARIFSFIISLIRNEKITDTTSGFRAYGKKAIKIFSSNYPEDYPEVEALILAHKKRLSIKEVSVRMRTRLRGKSSITPLWAVYYMIKVLLAIFVDLMRKYE